MRVKALLYNFFGGKKIFIIIRYISCLLPKQMLVNPKNNSEDLEQCVQVECGIPTLFK